MMSHPHERSGNGADWEVEYLMPEGDDLDPERKEELREAALIFESVIRESPLAINVFDRDERVMIWNPAAERLLGWSSAEVLGDPVPIIPDEARREIGIVHTATIEGEAFTGVETMVQRKDGEVIDVSLSTAPFYDAKGRINGAMAVLVDISEQKRAEEILSFLARVSAEITRSLTIGPIMGRLARVVLPMLGDYVAIDLLDLENERVERVATLHVDPAKATLAQELRRYTPALSSLREGRRATARGDQPVIHYEISDSWIVHNAQNVEHLRLMRRLAPRSMMIVPLLARRSVLGSITLAITDTRRSYGLRDLELAQEVARRAATAIENARLYEETEEAVRSRDDVMAIVSHDLRNPINTISMTTELLREREVDEETGKLLDIIGRATSTMEQLIRDLLDIARIEAGGLTVEADDLDPAELVDETIQLQEPLARERSVELVREVPHPLPKIRGDRGRILQVFQNLIDNALEFTPEGGSITVRAEEVPEAVRFEVHDSGPGIDPAILPHIFDRFWQARERGKGGAGIGLAIARGIVETHGGEIEADSRPGRGATISFTIPTS